MSADVEDPVVVVCSCCPVAAGNSEEPLWSQAFNSHSPCVCVQLREARSTAKLGWVEHSLSQPHRRLFCFVLLLLLFFSKMSVSKVQLFEQMQLKSARKTSLIWLLMPWRSPLSASLAQVTSSVIAAEYCCYWRQQLAATFHLSTLVVVVFNATSAFKYLALILLLTQPRFVSTHSDQHPEILLPSFSPEVLMWATHSSSAPDWRPRTRLPVLSYHRKLHAAKVHTKRHDTCVFI